MAGETIDQTAKFAAAFKDADKLRTVRAPGRVNLIGEHVDYNEGFVLPMAIEPAVLATFRKRTDARVRIASTAFPGEILDIELNAAIERGTPQWTNYGRGVVAELIAAGIPLCGVDILLDNTLPVGGGLSSSAAVLVSIGLSLLKSGGNTMDADRLALICQRAEREFAGVPCGIMDQTIVAGGRAGHAMLLDCRDRSKIFVPIDPKELRVVIANTMVHHELSDGAYAQRVASCEKARDFFHAETPAVLALRDVTPDQLTAAKGRLDDLTFRRARHVVTEIFRTQQAADLLRRRRYDEVGELMRQSHQSLKHDYEVSCDELDFLAGQAGEIRGVYGARMTGGGFGGCIVALVQPRAVDRLIEHLRETYLQQFGKSPTVFATAAAAGASLLE